MKGGNKLPTSNNKGIKKQTVIMAAIVAFWICTTTFVLGLFKVHQAWPAFLVILLFFEAGAKLQNLPKIFSGGIVGLLWALFLSIAVPALEPVLGLEPAILLTVFLVLFLNIVLDDIAPFLFNSYGLFYFTVAAIFPEQTTLAWIITSLLGGMFLMGGVLVTEKIVMGNGHSNSNESTTQNS